MADWSETEYRLSMPAEGPDDPNAELLRRCAGIWGVGIELRYDATAGTAVLAGSHEWFESAQEMVHDLTQVASDLADEGMTARGLCGYVTCAYGDGSDRAVIEDGSYWISGTSELTEPVRWRESAAGTTRRASDGPEAAADPFTESLEGDAIAIRVTVADVRAALEARLGRRATLAELMETTDALVSMGPQREWLAGIVGRLCKESARRPARSGEARHA